jgi:hypothetical protein
MPGWPPVTDVTRNLTSAGKSPCRLRNYVEGVDCSIKLCKKSSVNLRHYIQGLCKFSGEKDSGGRVIDERKKK